MPFGGYNDRAAGWMIAVDTVTPSLASAFSAAPSSSLDAFGGMWASGGPAVDVQGNVYSTTGNTTTRITNAPGYWSQSVLVWGPGAPLKLVGTYTPWNYCQMDQNDADLSGGAAVILPDLGANNTSTPHLITFGGKQGNQYLVDRDHMPGSLVSHSLCSTDPSTGKSLVSPGPQPQFGQPGPLNVFGPYSETYAQADYAKGRSTGVFFRAEDGSNFLLSRARAGRSGLRDYRAAVHRETANRDCCRAPGLSRGGSIGEHARVSVAGFAMGDEQRRGQCDCLGAGGQRAAQCLAGHPNAAHPILYALDPVTLKALWSSTPAMLNVGGKYNTPGFGGGMVFVGTDRIQAFGLPPRRRGR